jgi:hypothetical protein
MRNEPEEWYSFVKNGKLPKSLVSKLEELNYSEHRIGLVRLLFSKEIHPESFTSVSTGK